MCYLKSLEIFGPLLPPFYRSGNKKMKINDLPQNPEIVIDKALWLSVLHTDLFSLDGSFRLVSKHVLPLLYMRLPMHRLVLFFKQLSTVIYNSWIFIIPQTQISPTSQIADIFHITGNRTYLNNIKIYLSYPFLFSARSVIFILCFHRSLGLRLFQCFWKLQAKL